MHDDTIPAGLCQCGCGEKVQRRFRPGHNRAKSKPPAPNPSGLCMCGCGEPAPIAKRTNREYGHVAGLPVRFVLGHQSRGIRIPIADRFWPKVAEAAPDNPSPNGWTGCWLWTASQSANGYGQINEGGEGRPLPAHRVAYELVIGPIPDGLVLDHLCRRPICVNPAHLDPVTQAVNCRRGSKSKLTIDQVREVRRLRQDGETLASIAARFGVAGQSIDAIAKGRNWRDDAC